MLALRTPWELTLRLKYLAGFMSETAGTVLPFTVYVDLATVFRAPLHLIVVTEKHFSGFISIPLAFRKCLAWSRLTTICSGLYRQQRRETTL